MAGRLRRVWSRAWSRTVMLGRKAARTAALASTNRTLARRGLDAWMFFVGVHEVSMRDDDTQGGQVPYRLRGSDCSRSPHPVLAIAKANTCVAQPMCSPSTGGSLQSMVWANTGGRAS